MSEQSLQTKLDALVALNNFFKSVMAAPLSQYLSAAKANMGETPTIAAANLMGVARLIGKLEDEMKRLNIKPPEKGASEFNIPQIPSMYSDALKKAPWNTATGEGQTDAQWAETVKVFKDIELFFISLDTAMKFLAA